MRAKKLYIYIYTYACANTLATWAIPRGHLGGITSTPAVAPLLLLAAVLPQPVDQAAAVVDLGAAVQPQGWRAPGKSAVGGTKRKDLWLFTAI